MGLFSKETIVTVSTSVSRVIQDNALPDAVKSGIIRDLVNSDNQLTENIQDALFASVAIRANQYYAWSKKNYLYGLPTSSYFSNHPPHAVIQTVLEGIVGKPVIIDYAKYDQLNTLHYGWQVLVDSYGYNQRTNELTTLSAQKGTPVYLAAIRGIIPTTLLASIDPGTLEQWGENPTFGIPPRHRWGYVAQNNSTAFPSSTLPYTVDASATEEMVEITYCWQSGGYQSHTFRIPISLPQATQNKSFFQVKYHFMERVTVQTGILETETQDVPVYRYLTYLDQSGEYPALDEIYAPKYDDLGAFFPFIYFRFDKQNQAFDHSSEVYRDSTKMCKFLNMGFADVAEAINSNPGIGDVTQAIFMMAVPANTTNPAENRYLFDFFYRTYVKTGGVSASSSNTPLINQILSRLSRRDGASKTAMTIQDKRFQLAVGFSGIRLRHVAGTIGKIGHCTSSKGSDPFTQTMTQTVGEGETSTYEYTTQRPYFLFKKQVAPGLCQELKVYDLSTRYFVDGSHTTVGSGDSPNLLIPLDYSITDDYGLPIREELYARSMHFVFNARQETSVSWYQQSWFSTVLIVIAVVWTVFTLGSDGGSALGAALAAGAYGAAAMIILENIVIAMLVKTAIEYAMKWVAKVFGIQFAMVLAVVLTVVASYYGMTDGFSKTPWAQDLLTAANGLVKASQQIQAQELQEDYNNFLSYSSTKTTELEKAQSLLGDGQNILSPFTIFGESPTNYYDRTVHSGNIGVWGIDAISRYVDTSLTLPTFSQTVSLRTPLMV